MRRLTTDAFQILMYSKIFQSLSSICISSAVSVYTLTYYLQGKIFTNTSQFVYILSNCFVLPLTLYYIKARPWTCCATGEGIPA